MIRAELYVPDDPERVVAVATWEGGAGRIEAGEGAPEGVASLLRPTPVVVDDASLRSLGAHGESLLQPGSPDWFRAALATRAAALGLAVRFVVGDLRGGWDPASNYRTFGQQAERIASG
jgi:hypothetical protein